MTATVYHLADYRPRRAEQCAGCDKPFKHHQRLCFRIDQDTGEQQAFCSEACAEISRWIAKGMKP